jgi:hypothetical protein
MKNDPDNAAADADFVAAINKAAEAMVAGLVSDGLTPEQAESEVCAMFKATAEAIGALPAVNA